MKHLLLTIGLTTAVGLGAVTAIAQQTDTPPPPRGDHMKERFAALDLDGDGAITKSEVSAKQAEDFALADTNADGFVTEAEMKVFRDAKRAERRAERQSKRFAKVDTNDDGALSLEEFQSAPNRMFDRADANGDGVIEQAELAELRGKRGQRKSAQ